MAAQAGQEALTGALQRGEAWCRGQTEGAVRALRENCQTWRDGGERGERGDNLRETFAYLEPADSDNSD